MRVASLLLALALSLACDRNIEPFDPDEKPSQPDLSRIFPEGAERAEQQPPSLPPAPGEGPAAPTAPGAPAAAARAGADARPVSGTITLAEGQKAPGGAVLFIIARRGGGGPPLAVKRVPNPSFPLDFELGPGDRMLQQVPFEGPLTLSARLDQDGNATTRGEGDLLGIAKNGPVPTGTTGIQIQLETSL